MNNDTETNNKINDVVKIISTEIVDKNQLDKKKLIDIIIRLKNINDNKFDYEIDIEPYEIWHKNKEYESNEVKKKIQTSIDNIHGDNDIKVKKSNINSLIIDITKLHIIEYNKLTPKQKSEYIPIVIS